MKDDMGKDVVVIEWHGGNIIPMSDWFVATHTFVRMDMGELVIGEWRFRIRQRLPDSFITECVGPDKEEGDVLTQIVAEIAGIWKDYYADRYKDMGNG